MFEEEEYSDKISLDELYDRKLEIEQNKLTIYKTILSRLHKKIKLTARQKHGDTFCFFLVPEMIIGVPRYDVECCVSYLLEKLNENGFMTRYTHPNLIFISWNHYLPSYKRQEIKKLTGQNVDGFGNVIKEENKKESIDLQLSKSGSKPKKNENSSFKEISSYKPSGIYNVELFDNIKKIKNL